MRAGGGNPEAEWVLDGAIRQMPRIPVWETSSMGPFDRWPSGGGGFEYFYGFIGGETNQYYLALFEGTTPVKPGKTPEQGYHHPARRTLRITFRQNGPTNTRESSIRNGTSSAKRPSLGKGGSA
jgi:arylsulfatase A-like enzyme